MAINSGQQGSQAANQSCPREGPGGHSLAERRAEQACGWEAIMLSALGFPRNGTLGAGAEPSY